MKVDFLNYLTNMHTPKGRRRRTIKQKIKGPLLNWTQQGQQSYISCTWWWRRRRWLWWWWWWWWEIVLTKSRWKWWSSYKWLTNASDQVQFQKLTRSRPRNPSSFMEPEDPLPYFSDPTIEPCPNHVTLLSTSSIGLLFFHLSRSLPNGLLFSSFLTWTPS
jgi:hypothetical protein